MDTVLSRPYGPDLGRWGPLVVVAVALAALVLLALGAAIVAGMAANPPADQLLAPFRWGPATKGMA